MLRVSLRPVIGLLSPLALVASVTPALAQSVRVQAQDLIVAHRASLSEDRATLALEMADGDEVLEITLTAGEVILNDDEIGRYEPGGAFETSFRDLVARAGELDTPELIEGIRQLDTSELGPRERLVFGAVTSAMSGLMAARVVVPEISVAVESALVGEGPAVAPAEPAPRADPAPRPAPWPDVEAAEAESQVWDDSPSPVSEIGSGLASLFAAFAGLAFMGFGFLFFAPKQLSVVSDTVWQAFGRSLMAGLFAQPLVLPLFGAMLAGLTLTVVGILLIPFAVAAFVLALVLAIIGGYIAVARTVGEIYVRRKHGTVPQVNTWMGYRYIVTGLGAVLAVWAPAVLFGRVPVAGTIFTVTAGAGTWLLATAGLGATILSRAGVRGTVGRRLDRALRDDRYWSSSLRTPASGVRRSTS